MFKLRQPAPARRQRASAERGSRRKRGPGRPTKAKAKAIDRELIAAARQEFYRAGFGGARMDLIAAAAGISKATLYARYATKEALLQAVVRDGTEAWVQRWDSADPVTASDLRLRLKHRARKLMQFYCSGKLQLQEDLFASGGRALSELRRMRYEVGHNRTVQVLAQDIVDAGRTPLIRTEAAIRIAEMLMALLVGWWRSRQEIGGVEEAEALAYADHAVDVLIDGDAAWSGEKGRA
jgi:TetR/AcrR family transcriptional regulator, mexJK operon transcriptional repressor